MKLCCFRWLRQTGGVEEAPIINFMRSAMAKPHERAETLQEPELAMVQYDQAQGQEEEGGEEGGYRLTFNTSSLCFAGTGAQARLPSTIKLDGASSPFAASLAKSTTISSLSQV